MGKNALRFWKESLSSRKIFNLSMRELNPAPIDVSGGRGDVSGRRVEIRNVRRHRHGTRRLQTFLIFYICIFHFQLFGLYKNMFQVPHLLKTV